MTTKVQGTHASVLGSVERRVRLPCTSWPIRLDVSTRSPLGVSPDQIRMQPDSVWQMPLWIRRSTARTVPATLLSLVNPSLWGSGVKTAGRTLMSHSMLEDRLL